MAPGTQQPQSFSGRVTKSVEVSYLLYLPGAYGQDPTRRWPLILFLHGAGERGDDLEMVRKHGIPRVVEAKAAEGRDDFPFITVSPQCPTGEWWGIDELDTLLDDVLERYAVDRDRVYLTGLSMGGFGTWNLAAARPDRFAAIAPVCGGGRPDKAAALKHLPIWTFHGAKDEIVPIKSTEDMVEAVRRAGGDVRFTVYREAGHDSWTETYANPDLYAWFLAHRRGIT
jgi:predicted peptidase